MDIEGFRNACDGLRNDVAVAVNATGTIEWIARAPDTQFATELCIDTDILDFAHPEDRAALLGLLTVGGQDSQSALLRFRNAAGGWSTTDTRSTSGNAGQVLLVANDVTQLCESRGLLEAHEAVLGVATEDLAVGVAFDALARAGEAAVPGAYVAIYVHRDSDYELVAAPSMSGEWARRAFRLTGEVFPASNEVNISASRGQLYDRGAEFQLGQPWVVVPPNLNGGYDADVLVVVYLREKRFLTSGERSALDRVGSLTGCADMADARRVAGREQSRIDDLTTVLTRRVLLKELMMYQSAVSVVLVRANGLSDVNTKLGYDAGDAVLQSIGASLRGITRGRDIVGRLDGHTFVIVAGVQSSQRTRGGLLDRVRAAASAPVVAAGTVIEPRCVVVETQSEFGEPSLAVLARAEAELHTASEANLASGIAASDR